MLLVLPHSELLVSVGAGDMCCDWIRYVQYLDNCGPYVQTIAQHFIWAGIPLYLSWHTTLFELQQKQTFHMLSSIHKGSNWCMLVGHILRKDNMKWCNAIQFKCIMTNNMPQEQNLIFEFSYIATYGIKVIITQLFSGFQLIDPKRPYVCPYSARLSSGFK